MCSKIHREKKKERKKKYWRRRRKEEMAKVGEKYKGGLDGYV